MRALLACLLAAFAGPAFADMTAVYEGPAPNSKTMVETAANGDFRADLWGNPGAYILSLGGKSYLIMTTSKGVVVDGAEDLGAAFAIVAERRWSADAKATIKKTAEALTSMPLSKGDDLLVRGRKGTPYYLAATRPPNIPHEFPGVPPLIVISSDPDLAAIGKAVAREAAISDGLIGSFAEPRAFVQVEAILQSGAPIAFFGAELTTVSRDPISPSRFALPAPPESREDIIKRIDATATSGSIKAF